MQVFVCGMHRSGTSMVARLLNLMGAYFGPEGSGLPANRENPKGFWERRDVVELNDRLLAATDSVWYDVHGFLERGPGWRPPPQLVEDVGAKVLDIDAHRPWFIKDPRLCLTLPYWLEHCERPVAVVCSRSPHAVIASLAKRTEITGFELTTDEAAALWEAYSVELLRTLRGVPSVFVRYEDVLASPHDACRNLAAALTDVGVRGLQVVDAATARAFVDVGLRRSDVDANRAALPAAIANVDARFDGRRAASADAAEISPASLRALQALRERLAESGDMRRVQAALNARRAELEAVLGTLASAAGDVSADPWTVERLRAVVAARR